jgi:hypothetical protein
VAFSVVEEPVIVALVVDAVVVGPGPEMKMA